MTDISIGILTILKHYFKLSIKATEAIQEVEKNDTISYHTV